MDGPTLLLIHNIGYVVDSILMVALIAIVLVKARDKIEGKLLVYSFFFVLVFTVSHVIGVNIKDPFISMDVLMANLSIIFIPVFLTHFILVFIGKEKERKWVIIFIYFISFVMLALYVVFPRSFLLPSVPKLYFPNYYVAGSLHFIMRIVSNFTIPIYGIIEMVLSYRLADSISKNRIKYISVGIFLGYFFGFLAIPLVFISKPVLFGVLIDPVWSIFFVPLFAIPFTYAVVKYELADIKIVAKQALGWLVLIEIVGVFISLLIFFIDYIRQTFPYMPIWILPIVLAIIFVLIGAGVWRRLSETDVLKYEFITVITHKFRTPLTRIKWAAEDMAGAVPMEKKEDIDTILESERQLLALTDTLVHLSAADVSSLDYHMSPISVESIFQDLSNQYSARAKRKGVDLTFSVPSDIFIMIDPEKSSFIFQILLDNSLNYTPAGGSIVVKAYADPDGKRGTIEVADTGIGMSRETASMVFKRFYRGNNARHADTEGMGIGLFMAKNIIEKQNGKISVKSEGEGKGSTFSIHLPLLASRNKNLVKRI